MRSDVSARIIRECRRAKCGDPFARVEKPRWADALSAAVRERRKVLGLTQHQVALLAGCGPVFIYAVETGKPSVRLDKLVEVLNVLGLELILDAGKDGLRVAAEKG
jgi:y4mF family transcriptional regulator